MEERVNYTLVGGFVIFLLVALLSIAYWLSHSHHHKTYDTYLVYMQEAVAGLNEMAPVKYNGVVVGFVKDIQLYKNNPQLVELVLQIEEGTPITEGTLATLLPQGITGMTYIGLKTTKVSAPPLKKTRRIHYPVIPSEKSPLVYFGDALLSASNNLNHITQRFDQLFNEKSISNLNETISNVTELSKIISANKNQIDASLKSTTRLLYNTTLASEQLPELVDQIKKTINSVKNMSAMLNEASVKVNGSLQSMSQQALPVAVRTLSNLEQASQHLQQLVNDVQRNPSVVLRGKKVSLGPGEHE